MQHNKAQFIAELFEQQSTPLVKYLTARFKNPDEAKEVAQEAWLRMYKLDHPEALDNPKAFLFQTASNLSIDRLRHAAIEKKHPAQVEEPQHNIEAAIQARQTLNIIEAAMNDLPHNCRQAFTLHRHKNLSYPQIAQQLGVSTSMVEKYIIQSLKHFRNKIDQQKH